MAKIDVKQLRRTHITNANILENFVKPNGENGSAKYQEFVFDYPIRKIGYLCSEEEDLNVPIYLFINGEKKRIFATKGVYVLHHNDELLNIEKVLLPEKVNFIFDYELVIN